MHKQIMISAFAPEALIDNPIRLARVDQKQVPVPGQFGVGADDLIYEVVNIPIYEGIIINEGKSLNPSFWTRQALIDGAHLFKNSLMFANHQTFWEWMENPARDVTLVIGKVINAYTKELESGQMVIWGEFQLSNTALGRDMQSLVDDNIIRGLSITAYVDGEDDEVNEWFEVQRILDPATDGVYPPTVDMVTYPATQGGFAATEAQVSQTIKGMQDYVLSQMNTADIVARYPALIERVKSTLAENNDATSPVVDAEADQSEEDQPDQSDEPAEVLADTDQSIDADEVEIVDNDEPIIQNDNDDQPVEVLDASEELVDTSADADQATDEDIVDEETLAEMNAVIEAEEAPVIDPTSGRLVLVNQLRSDVQMRIANQYPQTQARIMATFQTLTNDYIAKRVNNWQAIQASIEEAIANEVNYAQQISSAGQPVGQGGALGGENHQKTLAEIGKIYARNNVHFNQEIYQ